MNVLDWSQIEFFPAKCLRYKKTQNAGKEKQSELSEDIYQDKYLV